MWYGSKFPDAPPIFETPASFKIVWEGPATRVLGAEEINPRELRVSHNYELARRGESYLTPTGLGNIFRIGISVVFPALRQLHRQFFPAGRS